MAALAIGAASRGLAHAGDVLRDLSGWKRFAAALIAGDHHDRPVPAADLLIAAQLAGRQPGHRTPSHNEDARKLTHVNL